MNPHVNRHLGTVQSHENGKWQIRLADPEGCAVCHRGLCWDSNDERIVEVHAREERLTAGQKVWVEVSDRSGWRAIALFYGLPSLLLITLLLVALAAGVHEGVAGAGALLALVPYYLVLSLTQKNWKNKIHLSVRAI